MANHLTSSDKILLISHRILETEGSLRRDFRFCHKQSKPGQRDTQGIRVLSAVNEIAFISQEQH